MCNSHTSFLKKAVIENIEDIGNIEAALQESKMEQNEAKESRGGK